MHNHTIGARLLCIDIVFRLSMSYTAAMLVSTLALAKNSNIEN